MQAASWERKKKDEEKGSGGAEKDEGCGRRRESAATFLTTHCACGRSGTGTEVQELLLSPVLFGAESKETGVSYGTQQAGAGWRNRGGRGSCQRRRESMSASVRHLACMVI